MVKTFFFITCLLGILLTVLFVPVRCHFTEQPSAPSDGIGGPNGGGSITTMGSAGAAKCFSILRKEFWTEPTWPLHFVWISSLDNYQIPGFWVTPVVIQR